MRRPRATRLVAHGCFPRGGAQPPQGQASEKWAATMAKLLRDAEPLQHTYLFNLHGGIGYGGTAMLEECPCLCRSDGDVWISSHGRAFNLRERCRLQGMSPHKLKVVVSEPQWHKKLGSAMSVNMLRTRSRHMLGMS